MPSNVKLFFGLTCAVVAYWLITTALFWVQVGIPFIVIGGGFGNQMVRDVTERNVEVVLFVTLPLCAAMLGLAWLAAFRHQGWARFAFLGLVVLRDVGYSIYAGSGHVREYYLQAHLARPEAYLATVVFLLALLFVFTGNARTWFRASLYSEFRPLVSDYVRQKYGWTRDVYRTEFKRWEGPALAFGVIHRDDENSPVPQTGGNKSIEVLVDPVSHKITDEYRFE